MVPRGTQIRRRFERQCDLMMRVAPSKCGMVSPHDPRDEITPILNESRGSTARGRTFISSKYRPHQGVGTVLYVPFCARKMRRTFLRPRTAKATCPADSGDVGMNWNRGAQVVSMRNATPGSQPRRLRAARSTLSLRNWIPLGAIERRWGLGTTQWIR